jgi:hypothetical protein
MLSDFYRNSINTISILLFYSILAFLIAILIINRDISKNMNTNEQEFKNKIEVQKGLIWTNYTIILIFFIFLLVISVNLFYSFRYQHIRHRKTGFIIRNIIMLCIVIVNTVMTIYMNKILINAKYTDDKSEINKIYIIVSFISIASMLLLLNTFSKTQKTITFMRNYILERAYLTEPSITRTSPISSRSSPSLYQPYSISVSPSFNDFNEYNEY